MVDCCRSNDKSFKAAVKAAIKKVCYGYGNTPTISCRRLDEISDYVCHWQGDILTEKSRSQLIRFDKLDMIFLCGDMNILPWDPVFMLVHTLLHMANFTGKVSAIFPCVPLVVTNMLHAPLSHANISLCLVAVQLHFQVCSPLHLKETDFTF